MPSKPLKACIEQIRALNDSQYVLLKSMQDIESVNKRYSSQVFDTIMFLCEELQTEIQYVEKLLKNANGDGNILNSR